MMMMVIPAKVAEDTLSQSLSSSYGQMDWCWENASWQILWALSWSLAGGRCTELSVYTSATEWSVYLAGFPFIVLSHGQRRGRMRDWKWWIPHSYIVGAIKGHRDLNNRLHWIGVLLRPGWRWWSCLSCMDQWSRLLITYNVRTRMIDVGNCWPAAAYDDLLAMVYWSSGDLFILCLSVWIWECDCEFVSGRW